MYDTRRGRGWMIPSWQLRTKCGNFAGIDPCNGTFSSVTFGSPLNIFTLLGLAIGGNLEGR